MNLKFSESRKKRARVKLSTDNTSDGILTNSIALNKKSDPWALPEYPQTIQTILSALIRFSRGLVTSSDSISIPFEGVMWPVLRFGC